MTARLYHLSDYRKPEEHELMDHYPTGLTYGVTLIPDSGHREREYKAPKRSLWERVKEWWKG